MNNRQGERGFHGLMRRAHSATERTCHRTHPRYLSREIREYTLRYILVEQGLDVCVTLFLELFGDYWLGPCIMDTGCSHHLLKIRDHDELLHIFAHFKPPIWNFRIGSSRGTTGSGLTLIVTNNAGRRIPVCIGRDIFPNKVLAHAMGYRFVLCGDDIRYISGNDSMMARFVAQDREILRAAQASTVPRLTASLIGANFLKQSLCLTANNIAFYLDSCQLLYDQEPGEMIQLRDLFTVSHALHARLEGVCADVEHLHLDICADFYFMEHDDDLELTVRF